MINVNPQRLLNQAAFRRMEDAIKNSYPYGHYVAIADEEIVGDAADFMTLYRALLALGRDPRDVMIIQAGHHYPEHVSIFLLRA